MSVEHLRRSPRRFVVRVVFRAFFAYYSRADISSVILAITRSMRCDHCVEPKFEHILVAFFFCSYLVKQTARMGSRVDVSRCAVESVYSGVLGRRKGTPSAALGNQSFGKCTHAQYCSITLDSRD